MKKVFPLLAILIMVIAQFTLPMSDNIIGGVRVARAQAPDPVLVHVTGHETTIGNGTGTVDDDVTGNDTEQAVYIADISTACGPSICSYSHSTMTVFNDSGSPTGNDLNVCYESTISNAYSNILSVTAEAANPNTGCFTVHVNSSDSIGFTFSNGYGDHPFPANSDISWHVKITMSYAPIKTCTKDTTVADDSTHTIIPTVETPVGAPTDDQLFATIEGLNYKISVDGGPWNDGATDRKDAVISWDGTTWTPLSDVPNKVCVEISDTGTQYTVAALSATFYIRVNDTAGNFADNTATIPFTYTIGLVTGATAPCESQYSYDKTSSADLVGFTNVDSTNATGVLASNITPLTVNDWYVVSWFYGNWQDDGAPPDRIDLQYSWTSGSGFQTLGTGGANVWCVSSNSKEVLIQASAADLYLRVNDEANTFSANTGTPSYNVYHVTFTRTPQQCETVFHVDDLIKHVTVQADQQNGVEFSSLPTQLNPLSGLTPGGWYVINTTDGPWNTFGSSTSRYDMAVSEGGSWVPLESWSRPICNVKTDTLGHRGVYFQMPTFITAAWSLRVNGSGVFALNSGSEDFDLYGATQLNAPNLQPGQCDYSYDSGHRLSYGTFSSTNELGEALSGLNADTVYALVVTTAGLGWKESLFSGEYLETWQISDNGGTSFSTPDQYPAALCFQNLAHIQTLYIKPGQNFQYKLRVDSTSFSDNTGDMAYNIYPATAGQTLVNTCFSGLSLQSIDDFDRIDPKAEGGELLLSNSQRYTEFVALVTGHSYAVEVPVAASTERWNNGTEGGHADVAVSKDNGTTWYPVKNETPNTDNPIVDCAKHDKIENSWTFKFTVQDGDVWKIRVNDIAGAFADNSGSLAYKFYVLCTGLACTGSVPNDGTTSQTGSGIYIQGGGDVCGLAVLRPGSLGVSELLDVGNYFGAWIQFINLSILRYMAWCPVHTREFLDFLNQFKTHEPLATIYEWMDNLAHIKQQIQSYDWGSGSGQDFSLWDVKNSTQLNTLINTHFFPSGSNSVWDGGHLISFGQGTGLPSSYYSCSTAFTSRIPSRLKAGVCFVSAYFIETSASFWIQIVLDVSAFFMLLATLKSAVQDVVYMMTGVKPWTKSGANASVDKLASYMENRDHAADLSDEALVQREMANGFRNTRYGKR